MLAIIEEEEEERKLYFNNLLHIHQHTFFKYMIQSVIEGTKSGDKYVCIRYSPNILYENTDTKAIVETINIEMPKIIEWPKSNKLHINVNKTVAMLFHTRQKSVNINENSIVIDGNIIPLPLTQCFWASTLIKILPGRLTLTI